LNQDAVRYRVAAARSGGTCRWRLIPVKRAAVILAAGKGTRMPASEIPKVMHQVGGKPMVAHVVEAIRRVCDDRIYVVVGYEAEGLGSPATLTDGRLPETGGEAVANEADAELGLGIGERVGTMEPQERLGTDVRAQVGWEPSPPFGATVREAASGATSRLATKSWFRRPGQRKFTSAPPPAT